MQKQTERMGRLDRPLATPSARHFGSAVFAICLVALTAPAVAQIEDADSALQVLSNGYVMLADNDKKKVATHLSTACRKLGRKIPSLSPRESDWLDAEIAVGEYEPGRFKEAIGSIEFAKWQARGTLETCMLRAAYLIEPSSGDVETWAWASLVRQLMDSRILADHLIALRKADVGGLSEDDIVATAIFPVIAKGIMDRVLIPRLTDPLLPPTTSP